MSLIVTNMQHMVELHFSFMFTSGSSVTLHAVSLQLKLELENMVKCGEDKGTKVNLLDRLKELSEE